jgi:hypothetical protein
MLKKSIIVFSLLLGLPVHASWLSGSLRYSCDLSFQISGESYFLALGYSAAEGRGEVRCYDFKEKRKIRIPVRARMEGIGAGLGYQEFTMSGGVNKALIKSSPEALLGSYVRVGASGAVGVGAGLEADTRISLSNGAFTLGIAVSG